jgi:murein DD-endopeptidase MepM/ murein hydrolase activator NlpD
VKRAVVSKLVTIGAMLGVGALMISTSLPANAFFNPVETDYSTAQTTGSQSIKVAAGAVEKATTRDSYTVTSLAAQLRLKYGNRNFSYTNNVDGTIQWPFPVPVPISSGFGPRISPCGGCSSMHQGVDFTPGSGVVIDAIADGVVSQVIASHAGLGNHIIIDHVINGQKVQSVYAHMLDGSFKVTVGQAVTVAEPIGQVGSTGESTGAHLHLEIHINNVPVDPFAWLKANAN